MRVSSVPAADLGLTDSRRFIVWGEIPPQLLRRERVVAVVGSRAAIRRMRERAADVVAAAEQLDCAIVSGGALGIDGAAHRAALERGVPQLLVHPCGPDHLYPAAHHELIRAVARAPASAVLFAVAEGTPPTRGLFASRNAIVVGVSQALVVAQAGLRSGTMNSARMALRAGISVGTFDASPGARALLGAGAHLLPLTGPLHDALAALVGLRATRARNRSSDPVLERLAEPTSFDVLQAALPGLGVVELVGRLTQLRAAGRIVEVSPGCYVRSPGDG